MPNNTHNLCGNCYKPIEAHAQYILDWETQSGYEQEVTCNKFKWMDNLEFLEMKVDEAEHKI